MDLALARAERDDSKLLALIAYRSRSGGDALAQQAYVKRFDLMHFGFATFLTHVTIK